MQNDLSKNNTELLSLVGRNALYLSYGTPKGEYLSAYRAAIITEARYKEGESADIVQCKLCVLNPAGVFFTYWLDFDDSNEPKSGTYRFPYNETPLYHVNLPDNYAKPIIENIKNASNRKVERKPSIGKTVGYVTLVREIIRPAQIVLVNPEDDSVDLNISLSSSKDGEIFFRHYFNQYAPNATSNLFVTPAIFPMNNVNYSSEKLPNTWHWLEEE